MAITLRTLDPDGDLLFIFPSPSQNTAGIDNKKGEASLDKAISQQVTTPASREAQVEKPTVHLLVSSKHMTLASPVFKAMLGPTFKEGSQLRANGKIEIVLDDDNAEAFAILATIAHGKVTSVPTKVGENVIFAFAMLADKYQMQDTAGYFASGWIEQLKNDNQDVVTFRDYYVGRIPLAETHAHGLLQWLTVAWVFQIEEIFATVTHVIAQRVTEQFFDHCGIDLPLPGSVIKEQINLKRLEALTDLHSAVRDFAKQYGRLQDVSMCRHCIPTFRNACDSMIFGSIKALIGSNESTLPAKRDSNFEVTLRKTQLNSLYSLCDATSAAAHSGRDSVTNFFKARQIRVAKNSSKGAHGLNARLEMIIYPVANKNRGLHLSAFRNNGQKNQTLK